MVPLPPITSLPPLILILGVLLSTFHCKTVGEQWRIIKKIHSKLVLGGFFFHTGLMRFSPFFAFLIVPLAALYAFPPNNVALPTPVARPVAQQSVSAQRLPAPTSSGPKQPRQVGAAEGQPLHSTTPFELGITHLRLNGFDILQGKRVGLLTHAAAVDERGISSIDVLKSAPGVNLVALYAPEHGIDGQAPAEKKIEDEQYDGLPVYSLYGDTRKPTPKMLQGIDCMVVDLQDIGSRSYTYISALKLTMQACFEKNIPLIVLDRPNPLGGLKVDGPVLDPHFKSYVGSYEIPYVHGLTIGELAMVAQDELRPLKGNLTVVKMMGWKRSMLWGDTGLAWRPTSPAVPTVGAAFGYPCTGLGAQLGGFRHGYGTEYPFRLLSHPKLTAAALKARLGRARLPGFSFDIVKPKKETEEGVYVRITNWNSASPIALSLTMLQIALEIEGKKPFVEINNSTANLFCKDWGRAEPLNTLRSGRPLNAWRLAERWQSEAFRWQSLVGRKYWLY